MKFILHRTFITSTVSKHAKPIGLVRSGTPPNWPRLPQRQKIKGVDKIVAVSSAKGGVGKSTVAANLSISFAHMGLRAGILDIDIFGPSIPTIFNLSDEPLLNENNQMIPLTGFGVKTMSMGYLVGEDQPVVWRGQMVMKALKDLLHQVNWGNLDVLVLDLPPGTGDTQITIAQQIVLDGAVIVSTPHTLAVKDAIKGVNMFRKMNIDVLGLVQNMSLFACPNCQHESHVFGSNDRMVDLCKDNNISYLGDIPLDQSIGYDADTGRPTVAVDPQSSQSRSFINVAKQVADSIGLQY